MLLSITFQAAGRESGNHSPRHLVSPWVMNKSAQGRSIGKTWSVFLILSLHRYSSLSHGLWYSEHQGLSFNMSARRVLFPIICLSLIQFLRCEIQCFDIYSEMITTVKFSNISISLHSYDAKSWLTGKDPDAGKDWRQEEKGMTEDEVVGWHHRLNGHEFE